MHHRCVKKRTERRTWGLRRTEIPKEAFDIIKCLSRFSSLNSPSAAVNADALRPPVSPLLFSDQLQQAALFPSTPLRCSRVSVVTKFNTGAAILFTAAIYDAAVVEMTEVHPSRVHPSACNHHLRCDQKKAHRVVSCSNTYQVTRNTRDGMFYSTEPAAPPTSCRFGLDSPKASLSDHGIERTCSS